jgi:hypothetical protein
MFLVIAAIDGKFYILSIQISSKMFFPRPETQYMPGTANTGGWFGTGTTTTTRRSPPSSSSSGDTHTSTGKISNLVFLLLINSFSRFWWNNSSINYVEHVTIFKLYISYVSLTQKLSLFVFETVRFILYKQAKPIVLFSFVIKCITPHDNDFMN